MGLFFKNIERIINIKGVNQMKISVVKDVDKVSKIKEALERNDGYCPCRLEKTPDTKCICKEFLESTSIGACHCGLYIKSEV